MSQGKMRVVVLFGGRSAEHEVSLLSARNVWNALDRSRFQPVLVSIDKGGVWRLESERTLEAATGDPRRVRLSGQGARVIPPFHPRSSEGTGTDGSLPGEVWAFAEEDVVFPVLHGTYGEDGTLQGLFDLAGVAYVGSGVLGSAVGMDKDVTKRLLREAGIPVVPSAVVTQHRWNNEAQACRQEAEALGFPLFVKPANAGSSVGVSRVKSADQLQAALELAFAFDRKVLLEKGINAREIECAVLGNEDPQASVPGEILVHHKDGFYSYDAKYVDPQGASWKIPAEIPADTAGQVRRISTQAFRVLELFGLARIDFFLDRDSGALYLNEVNTMPGFTAISMYPKMWEAEGLSQRNLVSRLVDLALERRDARRRLRTSL